MPVRQALPQPWHPGVCLHCPDPPKFCLSMVLLPHPQEMWGREDVLGLSGGVWLLSGSLVPLHLNLLLGLAPVLKISQ